MKISAKQAAFTAVLLTLAIVSQFLKNLSVYLTGPIINLILIAVTRSVFAESRSIRFFLCLLCVLTYGMLWNGTSRMILYIRAYQLTFLRLAVCTDDAECAFPCQKYLFPPAAVPDKNVGGAQQQLVLFHPVLGILDLLQAAEMQHGQIQRLAV